MLAMMLLSHAGDGGAKSTWPWHDVDVESCYDNATKSCR
jgi:hypothetical protein